VFAIAIALLILDVRVPSGPESLSHRLLETWPNYLAYVVSFLIIGIMWANHHGIFRLIDRTTHGLIVANLFLLLCVAFIPFPTAVLAENLRESASDQRVAAIFYSATFTVTAAIYNVLWQIAARHNRLITPGSEAAAADVTRRFRYGVPTYLAPTLAAIVSVPLGLAIDGAVALFYVLPQRDASTPE
jgi:TMEM175 potassium channel family protein